MLSLKDSSPEKEQVGRTIITLSWMMERRGGEYYNSTEQDLRDLIRNRNPDPNPDPKPVPKGNLRTIIKRNDKLTKCFGKIFVNPKCFGKILVNPNLVSMNKQAQAGVTKQDQKADMRECESPPPMDVDCVYAMTDASDTGYGVVYLNGRKKADCRQIQSTMRDDGIHMVNIRELNGLMIWLDWVLSNESAESLSNRRVFWFCDNKIAVADVNKREHVLETPDSPSSIQRKDMIRRLTSLESEYGFGVQAVWVPGATVVLADEGSKVGRYKPVRYDLPDDVPLFVGEVRGDTYYVHEVWLEYFNVFWPEFDLTYVGDDLPYYKDGKGRRVINGKLYLAEKKFKKD